MPLHHLARQIACNAKAWSAFMSHTVTNWLIRLGVGRRWRFTGAAGMRGGWVTRHERPGTVSVCVSLSLLCLGRHILGYSARGRVCVLRLRETLSRCGTRRLRDLCKLVLVFRNRCGHILGMETTKPTLGQTIVVHGITCVIVRILPFGTLYAESKDGHFFRVTGLSFR